MKRMWQTLKGWVGVGVRAVAPTAPPTQRREEGASMVEYALLVALIALVAIAGVTLLGTKTSDAFNNIGNKL